MAMKKPTFEHNWRYKTIESLEKHNYGDPNEAPTTMVRRCLELCKTPLDKFTIEDLRLMIGQEFSLPYLIPLAIEHLRTDIFVEGDLYPGDLLRMVLSVNITFWTQHKHLWTEIHELIKERLPEIEEKQVTLFYNAFQE
jgi:CDI immunity proteins